MSITILDFKPGSWEVFERTRKGETSSYVVDRTTGKVFENEHPLDIRCKACYFACIGISANTIASTLCMAGRFVRLATCYHLCKDLYLDPTQYTQMELQPWSCKDRCYDIGVDLLKLLGSYPLCIATQSMLWRTCIYAPTRNMKKYINAIDVLQFDGALSVAPCFHTVNIPAPPPAQEMTN